jgi:hypothetical protein
VFDPFVFKGSETTNLDFPLQMPGFSTLQPPAYFAYPAIAIQILVIVAVLVVGRFPPAIGAFLAGVLFLGMFVAGAIGVLLFPLSTLGLILLIGMLGYTPLFTAWAFGRRAQSLWKDVEYQHTWNGMPAKEERQWDFNAAYFAIGFVSAAAIPGAVGTLCLWLLERP